MADAPPCFRLYIAGLSPNSRRALANFAALREEGVLPPWPVETIDVFARPERALADGVLLTPQLLVLALSGERRVVVGDLGDAEAVRAAFVALDG